MIEATASETATTTKPTLGSFAYQKIREDILCGKLPPDKRLRFELLRELYGLNVGALREGLSSLVAEGLVIVEEQKGFRVSPVSENDLNDLTELRRRVDPLALRMSIERGDIEWESRVISAFHRLSRVPRLLPGKIKRSNEEWEARHRAFHRSLVSGSGSPVLIQMHATLFDRAERYRRMAFTQKLTVRDTANEHEQIMNAAIDRNVELACRLLETHVERTRAKILKTLKSKW